MLSYFVESVGLVSPRDEDHDLPRVHDGPDSHGLLWHLRQIAVEEASVGLNCVLSKSLNDGYLINVLK